MAQFLHTAPNALQGCPFWCLPLPHLQQMSLGSGTFLPFLLDLDVLPLLPLFGELWNLSLDFSFHFLDPFPY